MAGVAVFIGDPKRLPPGYQLEIAGEKAKQGTMDS
jgi:hypothetical protein